MPEADVLQAKTEIDHSLRISTFCMEFMGLSFKKQTNANLILMKKISLILSISIICYHVFSEIIFIIIILNNNPNIEKSVPLFHTFGYGLLSATKLFTLLYKKEIFGQRIEDLAEIWPVGKIDKSLQDIKKKSLSAWEMAQKSYFALNAITVTLYCLTPIAIYLYRYFWLGQVDAKIGYVWVSWYPLDKQKTSNHIIIYIFECIAGFVSVSMMASTDLLFAGMASQISMLLKLLHKRLENYAAFAKTEEEYFHDVVENVKLHQRLISYCKDLESAFSFVNLVNILISALNICGVVFVIVLIEPLMEISNKLFLISSLLQIGVLCWYGDEILHANADVAVSAYNNRWYLTSPRCRNALQLLILRSQKPIAFTAMNFTNISLVTYSRILMRSYSYFALLYTMYRSN